MAAETIRWYFDFISPFAYLQWPRVRPLLDEFPIEPTPILFAGILDAMAHKGPAEIPGKREFMYRHVLWQAREAGIPLRFPPAHPFNPLAALRLCLAAQDRVSAIDAIYDWIWGQGRAGDSDAALDEVRQRLGVAEGATADPAVKALLRSNTEQAVAAGVFGVPTLALGKDLFWGNDAHEFAVAALRDPAMLQEPEMRRVVALPVGVRRG